MEKKQFFETLKKFKTTIALALLTIVLAVSYNMFYHQLTYESSEFILFVRTNGTVRDLELNVHFYNLSYSKFEIISNKYFMARVYSLWPQYVTISVDEINSSKPVMIKLSSLSPVGNLSFDSNYPLFYCDDYSSKIPSNVTEIGLYSAIYAKDALGIRIRSDSDWKLGEVSNSKIQWSPFSYSKTTTLSAYFSLIVVTLLFTVIFALIDHYNEQKFRPWLTFMFTFLMIAIYILEGTSIDLLIHNYSTASLLLLSIFSFLFHRDYSHLFNNITVFIVSGMTIEYWLRNTKFKYKLFWFLFPAFVSSCFSIYSLASSHWPSIGASFWIIGQSITSFCYICNNYNNKKRITFDSISDIIFILFSGFCFLSSTYSYFAELAFYKFDETQKTLAGGHIIFFFAFTVLLLALIIFASKRLVRKFSFIREAIKELEAKQ